MLKTAYNLLPQLQSTGIIAIYGAGGLGREVLCLILDIAKAEGYDLTSRLVFIDDNLAIANTAINGIKVVHSAAFDHKKHSIVVAVGNPITRQQIVKKLGPNANFITLVHPNVVLRKWVVMGKGCVVMANAVLTCNITIGQFAIVNLGAHIGHDAFIGDYFTAAPRVNVNGNCSIGNGVYLATQVALMQGISVASNIMVGMGSIVLKNLVSEGTYFGNPARLILKAKGTTMA